MVAGLRAGQFIVNSVLSYSELQINERAFMIFPVI